MRTVIAGVVLTTLCLLPNQVRAHCDTYDGPVVMTAKAALEKADVTPVLKWVAPADETEVKHAFQQAVTVRKLGPEARALADQYFFETLVRLHRAGEGAPYEGLKPAGSTEPIVAKADEALASGSVTNLVTLLNNALAKRVTKAFELVVEKRKHADENVAAGREYVEAYVTYVHLVEGIHTAIKNSAHGEGAPEETPAHGH